MKPPPRKRSKPRSLSPVPEPRRPASNVTRASTLDRAEQRRLLNDLKRLGRTSGGNQDIDYASLKKSLPTRSIPEIHAVVESLKNKVISCASSKLKKDRYEEKKIRKPIEVWTHMASALAGTHEESISAAFSQMLNVSSTEPCTLRNCDPPKIYRPVGRTTPFRPVQGECPGTNTTWPLQVVKTPAPTMGPADRAPNSNPGTSPAATSSSLSAVPASQTVSPVTGAVSPSSVAVAKDQQPSEQHPTTISTTSTLESTLCSSHTPLSSPATGLPPVPSTAPSSAATSSHSTPCAAVQLDRTSKSVIEDSPRWLRVESVDFEKLYRYLGLIHKSNDECELTPMESAILLDLLMSLQEELPHLDCNKLHKHLIQVHQRLSSPADSKAAGELFKDLKDGLCAQRAAPSGPDSTSQQNTAGTADDNDVTDSGGKKLQPDEAENQSSKNNNTLSQSEDEHVMGLPPPLNPFMIPLKLLMRR